jgi:hypothetical protein
MNKLAVARPRLGRRVRTLASASILAAMPLLMGAEGGCPLLLDTLESPVQAITVLQENADGSVEVDLMIVRVDGTEQEWITVATNAELRTPDGDLVPLEMAEDGHYRAHSKDFPELVYEGDGTNYRVTFEIDDEEITGAAADNEFIAVVSAPADEISFELAKAPEFAGDTATVQWSPSNLAGLMEIRDPAGEVIYSTFNLETPEFDGSKWASLIHGGQEQLRVDVFAEPGDYTLSFCAVRSQEGLDEELSGGLGILSGFLAGRCADDLTITVAP